MDWMTLAIGLALIIVIYLWFTQRDAGLPPYPVRPLPLLGHALALHADPRPQFKQWHREVGDIYSLKVFGNLMVMINGYDLLREILAKRGNEFSLRPPFFFDEATGMPGKGVILASGANWKEQRTVTLYLLRAFGMGKNVLGEKIREELVHFMERLTLLKEEPTDLRLSTSMIIANIICSFLNGQRYEYDDVVFHELMEKLRVILGGQKTSELINVFPCLRQLPGDLFNAKKLEKNAKEIMDLFVNKFVHESLQRSIGGGSDDSFIRAYIAERDRKVAAGEHTLMDEENLAKIILDIFLAGTETTGTSILWAVLYAANYQDIQDKIFQEIENEIGTERSPTLQDKPKLVYLNAFIFETLRLASIAAQSIPRMASEETTIRGYRIPKGAVILQSLDSVLHDEKVWGQDVMTFKPERFLDQNGKLKSCDEFIPFGLGTRVCLGEGMAKAIEFLLLATMLQRFKIVPPENVTKIPEDYVFALDVGPVPFKVRLMERRKL
ncbi:cytochrome P450 2J1-like [Physella acuta]|uniref:cytochrome P450 2J1-like n=1 Tax=Physella acuta TaxID=109671 RepID=UPI0027DD0103|nr:cytochrome P450 2J1-like [Physella acuta]